MSANVTFNKTAVTPSRHTAATQHGQRHRAVGWRRTGMTHTDSAIEDAVGANATNFDVSDSAAARVDHPWVATTDDTNIANKRPTVKHAPPECVCRDLDVHRTPSLVVYHSEV